MAQTFLPDLPVEGLPESITPELARAFNAMIHRMGPDRVVKLAELLEMICTQTGYGSLTLVVVDHRCQLIKQEISHSLKRSRNEIT